MKYHYRYIVTYFDDLLIYDKEPNAVLEEILWGYILKGFVVPE